MIQKFVSDVCKILDINIPSISYNTSNFMTNTTMAQCDSKGTSIFIKKSYKPTPDLMFSIAHELRHIWQIRKYYDLYFSNYQTIDILGIEKYNLQPAEIDANAFASIIMIDFFHLQPQYQYLSNSVITAIKKRINEIIIELSE